MYDELPVAQKNAIAGDLFVGQPAALAFGLAVAIMGRLSSGTSVRRLVWRFVGTLDL
ncbi:MAG TPA: hypothetical protein VF086_10580 [Propionibacteriaceae bacterium]